MQKMEFLKDMILTIEIFSQNIRKRKLFANLQLILLWHIEFRKMSPSIHSCC